MFGSCINTYVYACVCSLLQFSAHLHAITNCRLRFWTTKSGIIDHMCCIRTYLHVEGIGPGGSTRATSLFYQRETHMRPCATHCPIVELKGAPWCFAFVRRGRFGPTWLSVGAPLPSASEFPHFGPPPVPFRTPTIQHVHLGPVRPSVRPTHP